ncbi:MAG: competence/damage-inducible protein A [Flavobacteriaceae bacterium]|nr:competence/damage-inducible protein A [Flavobacteriaceae bacterium]
MKASIVTIGDEILIGQIVDTNSQFIAKELDKLGFDIIEMHSISDEQRTISTCLDYWLNKVDLVVITGGLGPTNDDITKHVFCEFFEDRLVMNQEVYNHVEQLLVKIFNRPLSDINKTQALVPTKATVLFNEGGTAPGLLMKKDNTTYVVMPGVPFEMKNIFKKELVPYLQKTFKNDIKVHKTLVFHGIGESLLAEFLEEWEKNLGSIKLAYLPNYLMVRLRLTAVGSSIEEVENLLKNKIDELPIEVLPYIKSYDDEDILDLIINNLISTGKSISFAESCTGGRLATLFNEKAGASTYFKGSVVTYATQSKIDVLGVDKNTIEKYTVVSAEVAKEMALKARELFKSDYAIATTGNAGPTKGDSDVSLGTVFIGIAIKDEVLAFEFNFGQPREKVVNNAIIKGLQLIYSEILKK